MRIEIRPAARSTPEAPLYLWRVWHESRPVAFGLAPTRAEAERMAALARGARETPPALAPDSWEAALLKMKGGRP